jgi:hypothetical protein
MGCKKDWGASMSEFIYDIKNLDQKRSDELFEGYWQKHHSHLFGDLGYSLKELCKEYWDARGEE